MQRRVYAGGIEKGNLNFYLVCKDVHALQFVLQPGDGHVSS